MMRSLLLVTGAALAAVAAPAWAGPAHVLSSQTLGPVPADAAYAVAPALDAPTREVLQKSLETAGLRVTSPDEPHGYLVTVEAGAGALCSRSCSQLTLHNDANLDDYYRHEAVVVAQPNSGTAFTHAAPVAWYTVIQSDGLSPKRSDYLPALLRYGARAYGRNTTPEAPPRLEPRLILLPPNVASGPGA
jgi:hypothetical protein